MSVTLEHIINFITSFVFLFGFGLFLFIWGLFFIKEIINDLKKKKKNTKNSKKKI
jgi:Na+-driven multidrug efflux pump